MHLATYLGLLHAAEQTLAESFRAVGDGHAARTRRLFTCQRAGRAGATTT